MTTLKVNTHITADAIPEYTVPDTNESEAYKQSVTDAYNSYLHPVEKVQDGNRSSLNQRATVFKGFADENMPGISRFNVNGTPSIQNLVPDSKSEAFKNWLDEHEKKSPLHPDEKVQGDKPSLEKRTEVPVGSIEYVVKSKL
jgi:hypothetical protein